VITVRMPQLRLPLRTVIPAATVLIIVIFGRVIAPYNPEKVAGAADLPPSAAHLFGTDDTGLDVFSRVIAGAQNDVIMALLVTLFATFLGLIVGLVIGMNASRGGGIGLASRGVTRFLDLTDAIPPLVVGVVIVGLVGASVVSLSVALAFILMPSQARLTRAEVLKVRSDAYVEAALMAGLLSWQVTLRHVLPNSARPTIENCSSIFGYSVIVLASLGFLGIGLNPPTPEWGSMIAAGLSDVMLGTWWPMFFPAIALMLTVIAAASLTGALTRLSRGPAAR
jgi:peptide/nickel transport system permease protein